MLKIPADFYKVVSTATTLSDNVAMMKFLQAQSGQHALIGLCMGEQGIISRVLGVRAGSAFTFGAISDDLKTAPGQVTTQDLRSIYRIEQVDAATRVYGVAGDPIDHSLSPIIMNAALRRENVNAVYLPLHAKTLKDLLHCVRDIPLHGLSITMPYKQSILPHLDNTDAHTAKIGACNTVVRGQDGKLYGFNTDIAGVLRPLEQRLAIENAKVLVLGAGGAARAAVFGLKERGAEVWILNRTSVKARSWRARPKRAPSNAPTSARSPSTSSSTPLPWAWETRETARSKTRNSSQSSVRHGLRPGRNPPAASGARQGNRRHPRSRNVCATGRPTVRNLDRQARSRRRYATRGDHRSAGARRRPKAAESLTARWRLQPTPRSAGILPAVLRASRPQLGGRGSRSGRALTLLHNQRRGCPILARSLRKSGEPD